MHTQIAILDFGSQYTHLIARRIRQLGVLAKIYSPNVSLGEISGARGIILSGGPQSVFGKKAIRFNKKIFDKGVPVLGLCYGHQLIAQHFGGKVKHGKTKEYGLAHIRLTGTSGLMHGMANSQQVWMSHGDSVQNLPDGFCVTASTTDCPVAAMSNDKAKIYGLQFHPEVTHTTHGQTILKNFVLGICGCKKDWSIKRYLEEVKKDIRKTVGRNSVFMLVSGGVDSTVAFALLESVLGKNRVFGLHIDNGFMRKGESLQVKQSLARAGFDDLVVTDASEVFLDAVDGVVDPEEKRKIIGRTFLQVKDLVLEEHGLDPKNFILGQGTIYPDTIETGGTKNAATIKTHHNRVAEVLKLMKMGKIIEPLKGLYKDEVRNLGKALGLPSSLLDRHPFPGPGLAIRALCSSGSRSTKYHRSSHLTVLPLKSVGVQGDSRTYAHPVLLQGTASWSRLSAQSVAITNRYPFANRVVQLLHPKKVKWSTIRSKKATLTKKRLDLLREVDHVVNAETRKAGIYKRVWQFPVILVPLTLNDGETIILRPVESLEAMTVNFYQTPKAVLSRIIKRIKEIDGVDMVLYDVTNKPPGTIEWE